MATFNPDSVDGHVADTGNDLTFTNLRDEAGSLEDDTSAEVRVAEIGASTTSAQYANLYRGFMLFTTSGLGAGAEIVSANIQIYVSAVTNGLAGEASANSTIILVDGTPASDTELANSDFANAKFGTTVLGESVTQENLNTSAYNTITLNLDGIAAIDPEGITKLGTMSRWDLDDTVTGLTWGSNELQSIRRQTTAGENPPILTVNLPGGNNSYSYIM